jgi:mannose-6-phosphate isomerase-like protein (cupin superfamily)
MSHVVRGRSQAKQEVLTRERCYIRERFNDAAVPEFSIADCRVTPGVTTELHRLGVDEWYVIVEGRGMMEIDRQPAVQVGPGDTVVIPKGSPQRIRNAGTSDLLFQCICIPRFTEAAYEALE